MSSRPRVLVLFEYATLNGGEMSFLSVAPYLTAAGFELTACLFEEGPLRKQLSEASIEVTRLRVPSGISQTQKREQLARLLQEMKPELVHANSLSMSRLSAPVATSLEIGHLGHLRDIANISRQVIDDLSQSNGLIAVSQAVKTWYEGLGLPSELITVIHNGVDLQKFTPGARLGPIRAEFQLGDRLIIVGIGQLGLRKGFDIWLTAAELVAQELPECSFLIAGEQHSQKTETVEHVRHLKHRSEQGALAGKVHWLGRRDDIAQLLRESDLLLHAARQEPLGRVLLEALAVGTPIVATRVGGTNEIVQPEDHKLALAESDNAHGLATCALRILKSPSIQAEIRQRYPQWAAERFSAMRAGNELASQYQSVCDGSGRS